MRITALPIAIALLGGCAEAPKPGPNAPVEVPAQADPLASHRALIGEWVDKGSPRFTCYERWIAAGDSALDGHGYVLAKNDTVFVEDLRIDAKDGAVVYSARIKSQNEGRWVPFTALPSGPDSLLFENPGHDFPQCITYAKDGQGGWFVTVTGNENGTDRTERFHFARL